jgi:hypothetical protein
MLVKCFLLLVTLSSYAAILADMPMSMRKQKPLCTKGQCSKENTDTCSCYCSVKCGPREIEKGDDPKYDEVDGQCFCAPRDKALYHRNSCDVKEMKRSSQENQ